MHRQTDLPRLKKLTNLIILAYIMMLLNNTHSHSLSYNKLSRTQFGEPKFFKSVISQVRHAEEQEPLIINLQILPTTI
jgi:hypothetical protein